MPHRRHARPLHAQPADRSPVPNFLPPQPVADRDRRRWLGRGTIVALAILVGLTLLVPLTFAVLGPGRAPLAGGVAGAVSASQAPTIAAPSSGPSEVPTASSEPSADPQPPTDVQGPPPADELVAPPPIASLTGYRWPLSEGRISLPFKAIPGGEWINHGKRFHDGVDMASFCGARVGAAHDGVVLAAGRHFDDQIGWIGDLRPYYHQLNVRHSWSNLPIVVVIDDGNGYRSMYAHFRDVTVHVGQHVRAGQQIGHEGATGHASGCHVHYGLFSPLETKRFGLRTDIRFHMKLPRYEIARIDPLLVLPGGDVALRTRQIAKAIAAAKAAAAKAAADQAAATQAASPPAYGG